MHARLLNTSEHIFENADPSNLGRSLLEGNKDHLLSQAKSELMRQEHQVGSLNRCISELQQQAYAQRLKLQDAQHGYRTSSSTRRIIYEGKRSSEILKSEVCTKWEKCVITLATEKLFGHGQEDDVSGMVLLRNSTPPQVMSSKGSSSTGFWSTHKIK